MRSRDWGARGSNSRLPQGRIHLRRARGRGADVRRRQRPAVANYAGRASGGSSAPALTARSS